jgi:quinol monooxygenase YgiN
MHLVRKVSSGRSSLPLGQRVVLSSLLAAAAFAVVSAARAQTGTDPVFAVTYLEVATTEVARGVELVKTFRDASRREAANLEFTVLQEMSRPNRFVIMEGWKDQAAFEAHDKGTAKSEFESALAPIRNSPPGRHMLQPFANAAARVAPAGGGLYMVEHVDFLGGNPAIAAAAGPLVKALAEASQKEAGALRYDLPAAPAAHRSLRGRFGVDRRESLRCPRDRHPYAAIPRRHGAGRAGLAGQPLRPAPVQSSVTGASGCIGMPAAGGGLDNRAFARYPDSVTFSATGGGSWPS